MPAGPLACRESPVAKYLGGADLDMDTNTKAALAVEAALIFSLLAFVLARAFLKI